MNASASPTQRTAFFALGVSLLLTCLLGSAYVFCRWSLRDQPIDGLLRCITLVCAMVVLHAWGYRAYATQFAADGEEWRGVPSTGMLAYSGTSEKSRAITHWAVLALAQQLGTLFAASLLLDGGTILKLCLAAIGTYWTSVGTIAIMRAAPATEFDRALLRGGFLLLVAVFIIAARAVWMWKGVL